MSYLRVCFVVFSLLVAGSPVFAQSNESEPESTDGGEKAPGKQYRVEVITFQYLGPDSSAGESFDRVPVEKYLPSEPFNIDAYNRIREAVAYTDVRDLAGALERLRANSYYTVMSSSAWIQPLLDRSEAVEVPLGDEGQEPGDALRDGFNEPAPARVSGTLSVYGDYLLFVDLDLAAVLPGRGGSGSGYRQYSGASGTGGDSLPGSRNDVFRISERRRIKLEEFHYFDHPYMGAIVSVTRYEGDGETTSAQQ